MRKRGIGLLALIKIYSLRYIKSPLGTLDFKDPLHLVIHSPLDLMRLTACEKEPETVAWIESKIQSEDVFYDIGANVGAYSLIAARVHPDATIYAFEPSFNTFTTLNENIICNDFESRIIPFQLALGDSNGLLHLHLSSGESGAAQHMTAQSAGRGIRTLPLFSLDMLRSTLRLQPPSVMKVDVDGAEYKVFVGAERTLELPSLKSIIVEIDLSTSDGEKLVALITSKGFKQESRHPRGKGKSTSVFNYIFVR